MQDVERLRQAAKKMQLKIVIEFDALTGRLTVDGPIQNPMAFYGMLEMAKDVCHNFQRDARGQIGDNVRTKEVEKQDETNLEVKQ